MQYDEWLRTSNILKFSEYISYIKIKKSGPSSWSLHEKKCILLSVMRIHTPLQRASTCCHDTRTCTHCHDTPSHTRPHTLSQHVRLWGCTRCYNTRAWLMPRLRATLFITKYLRTIARGEEVSTPRHPPLHTSTYFAEGSEIHNSIYCILLRYVFLIKFNRECCRYNDNIRD